MGWHANDVIAMLGVGGEQTDISNFVLARRRNQHRDATNEHCRRKLQHVGAIGEDALHSERDAAVQRFAPGSVSEPA